MCSEKKETAHSMDDDKLGSHADGGDDQVEGDIDRDPNISATKTVHSHSDFLVAYSCPEGRVYAMFLQCYFGICQKKKHPLKNIRVLLIFDFVKSYFAIILDFAKFRSTITYTSMVILW